MKQDKTYLQVALGFINIILVVFGLSLIVSSILLALHVTHINLFGLGSLTVSLEKGSFVDHLVSLLSSFIILFVLGCVRQFFKNILAEEIFVAQNVKLAKLVALLLLIAAFLGNGILEFNGYSFFNVTYIVTALVVWTLGKVLEKANAIAEENEFTI